MIFLAQLMPTATGLSFWLSAAGNVALVITVIVLLVRRSQPIEIDKQPVRVTGNMKVQPHEPYVTAAECMLRHGEVDRRLTGHDGQIKEIWETLRAEDAEIRRSLAAAIHEFDQTVNRVDGTLASVEKTNSMILKKLLKED
jgi:hypothetical protein